MTTKKEYSAKKPKVQLTEPFWTRGDSIKVPMTIEDVKQIEKMNEMWKEFQKGEKLK